MDVRPWYRQPWPWFLIALPAVAVIGSVTSLVLAIRTDDPVVASDYYKRGLAINDEIKRVDRAAALGIEPKFELAGLHAGDAVTLRLVAKQPMPAEAVVRIGVAPAGSSDLQPSLVLGRSAASADGREATFNGAWRDDIPDAKSGKIREVVIETAQWRVETRAEIRGNSLTVPAPAGR